jgi:hypothetical protein
MYPDKPTINIPRRMCVPKRMLKPGIDVSAKSIAEGIMYSNTDIMFRRAAVNITVPCILNRFLFTTIKPIIKMLKVSNCINILISLAKGAVVPNRLDMFRVMKS